MGQALLPVSAVTGEASNPSLLPKQEGGLGSECPKTGIHFELNCVKLRHAIVQINQYYKLNLEI